MKLASALAGGFAGATALTLLHETVRRVTKDAPRMDLLGIEALEKTLDNADLPVPNKNNLFKITMAGDVIGNAAYYSLAGIGNKDQAWLRGGLLGLAAGYGAVYLPKPLGLNNDTSNRTPQTKLMTVALYLLGGLIAGATGMLVEKHWK